MTNYTGKFIISTVALDNTDLARAVIFISEDNEKGATGFIINHLFSRTLNELVEFKDVTPFPLYAGGPVATESLFFLHRRPDIIEDSKRIAAGIYLGGNLQQAITAINQQQINEQDIKFFIGYCGWDAGQLPEELAEGSWLPLDIGIEKLFFKSASLDWQELLPK
jgi:putative transcriptional regulator